ncbi:MAG: 4-hydroxy-tetrahydrodipicolinate reductase [Lachnospiraceae bacterium]|jgi:4-hydroxy-tetrahydrodipicolinate reductase|nr:4-hydroxy-tetrahydrodipicolinate reductase [Lachnospiraceae bacterium]
MIRVIMHGCNGRMGHMVSDLIADEADMEIVAGVDRFSEDGKAYPVYEAIADVKEEADVIVDFSNAGAIDKLLDDAVVKGLPIVLCSTGLSEEQLQKVEETSKKIAILKSANMSVGINLLLKLLKEAADKLVPAGYDVEIIEKHHNQKLDAPSGTAIALADSINEACDDDFVYKYDRSEVREKRSKKEIGISSVRGGTIVGEHDVLFCGIDEVIEFKHTATSRAVFGKGAIEAAKFLAGKKAGRFEMSDVVGV